MGARGWLDTLDPVGRQILELRFRGQRPQAEVARELGMSAPTLRKRERQIFRRFFEHMRRHGYFEHHAARGDLRTRRDVAIWALAAALGQAARRAEEVITW